MEIERVMYLLLVQEMDRAVDFYTNVIGFQKRSASPGWSELAFGDFTLALHGGGSGEGKKTGLSFTVSDIESACEEVEAAGGKVIKKPYEGPVAGLRLATTADAEGNIMEFGQHAR